MFSNKKDVVELFRQKVYKKQKGVLKRFENKNVSNFLTLDYNNFLNELRVYQGRYTEAKEVYDEIIMLTETCKSLIEVNKAESSLKESAVFEYCCYEALKAEIIKQSSVLPPTALTPGYAVFVDILETKDVKNKTEGIDAITDIFKNNTISVQCNFDTLIKEGQM